MGALKLLEIREIDAVGITTDSFTDPVADGKRAIVKYFGAAIPGTGVVDLYFGEGTAWEFIRSITNGTYEFSGLSEDYAGDGVKMFKITRTRQGGGGPLEIKTWFRAIEQEG